MKRVLPVFVIISLLGYQKINAQQVGNPAPDFEVTLVDGGTFKLSEQAGKVIFLFLFGNTCPNCIASGPSIEGTIHQAFAGDPNYVAAGLDIWDGSSASVNGFRNQTGITFPLAIKSSSVASDYNTTYDRLLVIDSNGILVHKGVLGAGADINNAKQAIETSLASIVTDPCETAEINILELLSDPTCAGEMNGSIDLTITGTYPGFSVLWSDGSTDEDRSGLGAGTINVTVTDSEGCTFNEGYNLSEPPPLNALLDITDNTCFGAADGTISVNIEGGTSPYITTYLGNEFPQELDNLSAGTYEILVSDANQCEAILYATINEPAALVIAEIDGSEVAEAFQTSSYTIPNPDGLSWQNTEFEWQVQGGSILNGNGSAMINVQWGSGESGWVEAFARDLSGCTSNTIRKIISISDTVMGLDSCQMAGIEISQVVSNPSCAGEENGSIQVNVSGNYPGFTFLWSNGMQEAAISGLGKGSYILTVTDSMGCTASKEFMLNEPPPLPQLDISGTELPEALQTYTYTVPAIMDVSYTWTVTGGTILSGQGTHTLEITWESAESGSIEVSAVNPSGCMSNTASKNVSILTATSLEPTDHSVFRLYPNPVAKVLFISSDVPFEITLFSLQGSQILVSKEHQIDLSGLSPGSYLVAFRTSEVSGTIRLLKQ